MNSDFKELLALLDKHNVRYVIAGGYAVMLYTEPRYTKDLDVVIGPLPDEANRTIDALAEFGFQLRDEDKSEFLKPNSMIVLGRPPSRIDVLNELSGIDFDDAFDRRNIVEVDGQKCAFLSLEDLILAKRASGRPQDLLDLKKLERQALRKKRK